jgi:phenylpropionate dioxygenase-like ring-hydroxylating dioxygenase large terminal subunit
MNKSRLLTHIADAIDQGELPLGVFNNPALFELEKEHLFTKSWNYLAHESEIPNPGDYVQRYIVDDSFIVSRDKNHTIHVVLNACRHRGRKVCSVEKGNTRNFSCPYHGWVYGLDGALIDIPFEEEGYGKGTINHDEWGLVPAPKMGIWRGMIFANLDLTAEPLDDYLGDAKWYMDFYANKSAAGLEVYGVPQRWVVDADWKLAADNFVGDGYHTFITHASVISAGLLPAQSGDFLLNGVQVALDHFGVGFARQDPLFNSLAYPPAMMEAMRKQFNPEQVALLDQGVSLPTHGNLFPNLSFLNAPGAYTAMAPPAPYMTFRVWRPLAAGKTEIWSWCMVEKDASEEFKHATYKAYLLSFGTSGTLEQDDAENWSNISLPAKGVMASKLSLNYSMGQGLLKPIEHWPGPGNAYPLDFTEFAQRAFWKKWITALEAE